MKIAFLVHRANHYKVFGPVIDEALKRNHQVELWLDATPLKKGKDYLHPKADDLPLFDGDVEVVTFQGNETVYKRALDAKVEIIVSLNSKSAYVEATAAGIRFVTLQYAIDTFIRVGLDDLVSSDLIILYTPFWLDWAVHFFEQQFGISAGEARAKLEPKVRFAGFSQMDILGDLSREKLLGKYGIPEGKRVVLLLPITLANLRGAWPRFFEAPNRLAQLGRLIKGAREEGFEFALRLWHWALLGWNDRALSRAIAEFARANNAVLIVKGREKDPVRSWLQEAADIVIYDERMYPATTMELLAISDLCIQFYSFAALEAVYCGVPSLTIDRPSPNARFLEAPPVYHKLWRRGEEGSAFHFPGAVDWISIPEAIIQLPNRDLDSFKLDLVARQRYLMEYLFPSEQKASEVILNLLSE